MSSQRKWVKGGNSQTNHVSGRRKRQETMLSIRKAKKEDAYATRRNLKHHASVEEAAENKQQKRKELLENIATRSNAFLLGIQHKDFQTRSKSLRGFVYLLSSGVPPLFDEQDPQHIGLWTTILKALPFFIHILQEPIIQDEQMVHCKSDAAFALRFISSMDKAHIVVQAGAIPSLVQLFQSGISDLQIQAAWCLGNIASESEECCDAIVKACPPMMVLSHIRMSTPALRRAAVWLLRSLMEFPEILEKNQIFSSKNNTCDQEQQSQSLPLIEKELIDTLSNIVIQLGIEKIQSINSNTTTTTTTTTTMPTPASCSSGFSSWRVYEFHTGKPSPNDIAVVRVLREVNELTVEVVDVDVNFETGENMIYEAPKANLRPIQVMDDAAFEEEEENEEEEKDQLDEKVLTLVDACWTLVELSLQNPQILFNLLFHHQLTIHSEQQDLNLVNVLVQLLKCTQNSVILTPVLRLVGNIISMDENCSNKVVEANLLTVMPHVMSHTNRSVREEACWMLSNIAGSQDPTQVFKMIQTPGLLQALVEQLAWAEYAVKREAAWSICNILVRAQDVTFLLQLLQLNVLPSFVPLLEEWDDPMLILVVLEAITSILTVMQQQNGRQQLDDVKVLIEESGCLDKMEELCYDENEQVSEVASHIMDTWFNEESNDLVEQDTSIAPTTNESGQLQFQPTNGATNVQFNFSSSSSINT